MFPEQEIVNEDEPEADSGDAAMDIDGLDQKMTDMMELVKMGE